CDVDANRLGTLWFYNNSFYEAPGSTLYAWYLFDTSAGGGYGNCPAVEWPQIQVLNNAFWMDNPAKPYFYWNLEVNQFTTFAGVNVVNSNWGSGNMTAANAAASYGTGWAAVTSISPYAFQGASTVADTVGVSNLIGVSTAPFDLTTFVPNSALINAGTNPPPSWPKLPVRFQFGPSAVVKVRTQPRTIGAMERSNHSGAKTGPISADHRLPERKKQ
ncbi:MAG: hypothetical protein ACYCPD_11660, partial [Acidobacteriaceae bacterium]